MVQKVIIMFWWEFGLSSASTTTSPLFANPTLHPIRMFKIVFRDSSLYPKQLSLFSLLRLISASADGIGSGPSPGCSSRGGQKPEGGPHF